MPFISTKVNVPISKEQEKTLTAKLGKAIELIPGKSESKLMLSFEGNASMYFKGSDDLKVALVEVKLFGKADAASYDNLTDAITVMMNDDLKIDHTYVTFEEIENWGKMHFKS